MLMLIPHICMVQNSSVLLSLFSLTQQCMLFYIMKIAFSFSEKCSSLFWKITLLYSEGCFFYFEKCSSYSERLLLGILKGASFVLKNALFILKDYSFYYVMSIKYGMFYGLSLMCCSPAPLVLMLRTSGADGKHQLFGRANTL